MTDRPAKLPVWADDPPVGYAGIVEPNDAKKRAGFRNGEEPAAGHFNWFFNLVYQWVEALSPQLDADFARAVTAMQNAAVTFDEANIPSGLVVNTSASLADDDAIAYVPCSDGKLYYTRNLRDWISVSADDSFTGIFSGGVVAFGLLVLFGEDGEVQTAPIGGSTLTHRTLPGTPADIRAMCLNVAGTKLVAVSSVGTVYSSSNGTGWGAHVNLGTGVFSIASGYTTGDTACIVAADGASAKISVLDGADAVWASHTIESSATIRNLIYSSELGLWVAVGTAPPGLGGVWTSPDAVTWTRVHTAEAAGDCNFVTPVPGGVLVTGSNGAFAPVLFYDGTTIWPQMPASMASSGNKQASPVACKYVPGRRMYVLFHVTDDDKARGAWWSPIVVPT